MVTAVELVIKGDRLEKDFEQKHGELLLGSTPYSEEVLRRVKDKWSDKFPVKLDGLTSQSEIIKLERDWINFHSTGICHGCRRRTDWKASISS